MYLYIRRSLPNHHIDVLVLQYLNSCYNQTSTIIKSSGWLLCFVFRSKNEPPKSSCNQTDILLLRRSWPSCSVRNNFDWPLSTQTNINKQVNTPECVLTDPNRLEVKAPWNLISTGLFPDKHCPLCLWRKTLFVRVIIQTPAFKMSHQTFRDLESNKIIVKGPIIKIKSDL